MESNPATPVDGGQASRVEQTAELLRRLCVTGTNIGMYGLSHPIAQKSIAAAFEWLERMIGERQGCVVLDIADDKVLFDGLPVETRNPQVARLASRLYKLHVNNLSFLPGLTREEFGEFQRLVHLKEGEVEAGGGLAALAAKSGVSHVGMSKASYVLVTDEQRVVSRDAKVVEGAPAAAKADSNEDVIRYMFDRVMKETQDREWVLNRIKNNPQQVAELIARSLDTSLFTEEGGESEENRTRALLDNIKLIGYSLMDEGKGGVKDGHEEIKDAILTLETEIKNRSSRFMGTEASARFLNEILGVVTTFADQVKAKRISDEFLRDESSLRKTEALLRKLSVKSDGADELLKRLHDLMVKQGLTHSDIEKLVEKTQKRAKPRRREKPLDQVVADGIAQRVKDLGLQSETEQETVQRLASFFEARLKESSADDKRQIRRLTDSVRRRDAALDAIVDQGLVIWDAEGRIEYANEVAAGFLGREKAESMAPALLERIRMGGFPLDEASVRRLDEAGLGDPERRFLLAVAHVFSDAKGVPLAVLLRR